MNTHSFKKDKLTIHVLDDRRALGQYAASLAAARIKELARTQDRINTIFAAAPSQHEFLAALAADTAIPWQKIHAFHMDEYIGLPAQAPRSFAHFLHTHLFGKVPLASVNYIDGNAPGIDQECLRYTQMLETHTPDIAFLGIGENTHLAFNDPHVADFQDTQRVKQVTLDQDCRLQQVHDGCFATLEEVPEQAITLTLPALMAATYIYCMVPGRTKEQAIRHTLHQPISSAWPSTILRTHDQAILFVDRESYQG